MSKMLMNRTVLIAFLILGLPSSFTISQTAEKTNEQAKETAEKIYKQAKEAEKKKDLQLAIDL